MKTNPNASSQTEKRGRLLRVLGVGFGLAVIIGNTIGAGIFRAPGEIAGQLPNQWLFLAVWVVGGLYALLGAFQIAELGTMLPRSGGQYVFSRYALGEYAGFIVGWSDWISTCGSAAAVSIVIGDFAGRLCPVLAGKTTAIAATVAIVFAVLQWQGIVLSSVVQDLTSFLKALAFILLVIAAFVFADSQGFIGAAPATITPARLALFGAFVIALQSVIYTYDGWAGVVYFSEEVRNPSRDIPRSLFSGVLAIIGIYLLVNFALLHVLPISKIAGEEFAAGEAAKIIFGRHGGPVFLAVTILSMLSAINAYHLMATRVIFSMSRDRLLAEGVARVNQGGTPTFALFLSASMAVLIILFGKTFGKVITVLAFFFVANYTLSFISVFVLRLREPKKGRPYRAWGYPWTTALALFGSVAFLGGAVASDTRNSVYALLLLAASYPAFLLTKILIRRSPA